MFGGYLSSEVDSTSDFLLSSGSSIHSERSLRCCSSLGIGLGVWLGPGAVLVEGLLTKYSLLTLRSEMVVVVPSNFLGL
jgi:hypothetical protein